MGQFPDAIDFIGENPALWILPPPQSPESTQLHNESQPQQNVMFMGQQGMDVLNGVDEQHQLMSKPDGLDRTYTHTRQTSPEFAMLIDPTLQSQGSTRLHDDSQPQQNIMSMAQQGMNVLDHVNEQPQLMANSDALNGINTHTNQMLLGHHVFDYGFGPVAQPQALNHQIDPVAQPQAFNYLIMNQAFQLQDVAAAPAPIAGPAPGMVGHLDFQFGQYMHYNAPELDRRDASVERRRQREAHRLAQQHWIWETDGGDATQKRKLQCGEVSIRIPRPGFKTPRRLVKNKGAIEYVGTWPDHRTVNLPEAEAARLGLKTIRSHPLDSVGTPVGVHGGGYGEGNARGNGVVCGVVHGGVNGDGPVNVAASDLMPWQAPSEGVGGPSYSTSGMDMGLQDTRFQP
jgi:hypothetical protein